MNGQVVNTRRRRRRAVVSKAAMRKDEKRNARLLRQKFGSPMKEKTAQEHQPRRSDEGAKVEFSNQRSR